MPTLPSIYMRWGEETVTRTLSSAMPCKPNPNFFSTDLAHDVTCQQVRNGSCPWLAASLTHVGCLLDSRDVENHAWCCERGMRNACQTSADVSDDMTTSDARHLLGRHTSSVRCCVRGHLKSAHHRPEVEILGDKCWDEACQTVTVRKQFRWHITNKTPRF